MLSTNGMKKTILIASVLIFLGFVPQAFAQGFVPLAPIPGLTDIQYAPNGLAVFFNNLYKYLIGLAAALAVIMIIWGGLEYSTQDSISKKSDGKQRIYDAIFGLVLVLSPALVFSIINPSILNLSLNLPPLDTKSGWVDEMRTTVDAATAAATTAGCTVTGTLLKTAVCTTQQAAQDFSTACPNGLGSVPFFTTDHKATCGTGNAGPYSFVDLSQSTGLTGWFNSFTGYSYYQPLATDGNSVLGFAAACTADGGTTCMSAVKTPCSSNKVQLQNGNSVYCWSISLSCTDGKVGAGGCSSSPSFTPVQTK